MWGQLRKGIGESVLSKIGEVVAPPPSDDEDDYDSASSYEEEYVDYDVDYDDDAEDNDELYQQEDENYMIDGLGRDRDNGNYDDDEYRKEGEKEKGYTQKDDCTNKTEREEINVPGTKEDATKCDDDQMAAKINDCQTDREKEDSLVISTVGSIDDPRRDSDDSVVEQTTMLQHSDTIGINDHEEHHRLVTPEPKFDCNSYNEDLISKNDSREEIETVETSHDSSGHVEPSNESSTESAPILKNLRDNINEDLKSVKELVARKDNQIKELERAQRNYIDEIEQRFSVDIEQLNCKLVALTKELRDKEIEIESSRQRFEEYKLLVEQQHTNEVEQLRAASNRAMLELNERTNEVTTLQERLEELHDEMNRRHASEFSKFEQLLNSTKSENQAKSEEIQNLKSTADELRQTLKVKQKELDEVDSEADELHQLVEDLEASNGKLKERIAQLENDSKEALGLHIEMQLLKEERDREALKASTLQESKESNQAVLTAELNAARAEVLDLQQRLAALQADLDVAKADKDRAITASSNLQRAMEAFESERDAELEILEESRKSAEEAMLAAHELALQALKKDNNRIIEEMQIASNKAIKNMMDEIKDMERKQEEYLRENVNLRRSLDEAIQRLHSKEEDVIDRSLMKNILLDWHSKSGKAKRDVLTVMSSVLHFTEEEKEKCGLIESQHAISKVVGTLAPPLNPAAKSPEELDGDSIREKWVSFLLAECGESPQRSKSSTVTRKRNQRSTEASDI